jgi:1-deoxyxylulose-5-phosphate synthase
LAAAPGTSSGTAPARSAVGISAPIVGATKQQHLADAAAALDVTLSDDDVKVLDEHYSPRQPTGY